IAKSKAPAANPQSATANPQSAIRNPQSPIANPTDVHWRYIFFPFYYHSNNAYHTETRYFWPFINITREGEREYSWSFLPRSVLPLISWRWRTGVVASQNEYARREISDLLILPLLIKVHIDKGRIGRLDAANGMSVETPGELRRIERQFFFFTSAEAYARDSSGNIRQDLTQNALFPLYATASDNKNQESYFSLLYRFYYSEHKPEERHWDVLWYLMRGESTPKSSRFGILWRLYESSQDEQGVKRVRLLFSPAFRIAGPKPPPDKR
ncbi:MAG: hypothetical protein NTX50_30165, partial [Candidatus Sumerlaeota bacterium]|nr:hypothetical protein [Candidatus Sumerlaeota bacterium]